MKPEFDRATGCSQGVTESCQRTLNPDNALGGKMTPKRDQQTMDIFLAAVELADERRGRYLDKACGGDHGLRSEINSLLRHHVPDTLTADDGGETKRDVSATLASMRHLIPSRSSGPRIWVIGLVLAACFATLWYVAHQSVQSQLRQSVESQMQTVLNADVAAIEIWLAKQKQMAENWANHQHVRKTLSSLAQKSFEEGLTTSQLESTDVHAEFLETIGPLLDQPQVLFVGVFARNGHGIAKCPHPHVPDVHWSSRGAALISRCFNGETIFMPTFRRGSNVVGGDHGSTASAAVSVAAPVMDESGDVIAAIQLILVIDQEFAKLFSMARIGSTGDSYAFDQRGVVLSELRQEPELRRHGLIPENSGAALHLHLRDPGVDLRTHSAPVAQISTRPVCKVPALAIANGAAVDAVGYRNYLGVNVVGAAKWLPEYDFGVVTEIEREEAYSPLRSLSRVFGIVFGCLAGATIFAALMSINNSWLRKEINEARKLGQYTLQELIGQGGMAKVYRATHAVLRRPTAIKLIERHEASDTTVARFEREARLASELNHPNTIQIYDYGRTENGTFYFVMEYLPGVSLAELIIREGALPPARVVHILRQVCASLAEAHNKGMIHRDIKPANIMLCDLGGQYDVVKVLDFGLVQSISSSHLNATHNRELTGTPLYIAPERIRRSDTVDERIDIYAVGTVAFYLLTGEFLFDGDSTAEILYSVVNEFPRRPSQTAAQEIPAELDNLIISCLQKDPKDRLQGMGALIEVLDSLAIAFPWTQVEAQNVAASDSIQTFR